VLERHRLAIVAVLDGMPTLVGDVDGESRRVWERLRDLGPSDATTVALALGADAVAVDDVLDALAARHLVVRLGAAYAVPGSPVSEAAA
jgi:hypothetical protein